MVKKRVREHEKEAFFSRPHYSVRNYVHRFPFSPEEHRQKKNCLRCVESNKTLITSFPGYIVERSQICITFIAIARYTRSISEIHDNSRGKFILNLHFFKFPFHARFIIKIQKTRFMRKINRLQKQKRFFLEISKYSATYFIFLFFTCFRNQISIFQL